MAHCDNNCRHPTAAQLSGAGRRSHHIIDERADEEPYGKAACKHRLHERPDDGGGRNHELGRLSKHCLPEHIHVGPERIKIGGPTTGRIPQHASAGDVGGSPDDRPAQGIAEKRREHRGRDTCPQRHGQNCRQDHLPANQRRTRHENACRTAQCDGMRCRSLAQNAQADVAQ